MKNFLLLSCLAFVLLATACNRKANQVVTARPAAPAPKKTEKKDMAKIASLDKEYLEDSKSEPPPRSRAARAALAKRKAQIDRIAQTGQQEVVAQISQTGCEGDCPVFTLQIMTDNTLHYEGKANVDLIGKFTGTLPFNPMTRLNIIASSARYFNLPSSFPSNKADAPADLPSVITKIDYRGFSNQIEHIQGGPEGLLKVEDYLRDLVNQATWTEVLPDIED